MIDYIKDKDWIREQLQHKASHIINELTRYAFGIHLLTCSNCGCLCSVYPKRFGKCPACGKKIDATEDPDFFY